jgi:hypothetical protein
VEAVGVIGILRADSVDLPLFLHVLGSMVLVGGLVLAALYLVPAWRGSGESLRLALRALLLGALPGYIVMRGAAEWLYVEEGLDDLPEDPDWIGIGYGIADIGLLLLIVATLAAWLAKRRGGTGTGVRIATVIVAFVLFMDLVAIWAMTTKPI